jgi:hypothetical protein
MSLPKAALLRAIEDGIPLTAINKLESKFIPPEEIEAIARLAITGGKEGGKGDGVFTGLTRYMFVGEQHPFIDPTGILLYRALGREPVFANRAADPVAMKMKTSPLARSPTTRPQPQGSR